MTQSYTEIWQVSALLRALCVTFILSYKNGR
jgi:hypothetical protein